MRASDANPTRVFFLITENYEVVPVQGIKVGDSRLNNTVFDSEQQARNICATRLTLKIGSYHNQLLKLMGA